VVSPAEKSTILLVTAAVAGAGGFLAWYELRARSRLLPAGTPAGTTVASPLETPGTASAPTLPAARTVAHVHWVPVDQVTQGQTYAFYDTVPQGLTTREQIAQALTAFGWENVKVDAIGSPLPAWLPIKRGVLGMFAARATWGLMQAPTNRPAMLVAYRPGTPVPIKQSQNATSLVHASSTTVTIYTVTDGTWWWGSFAGVGAHNQPIHPQAVGYTSAECIMKLQPILAHCVASSATPLPPMVAG
jgi:hypothetical protein